MTIRIAGIGTSLPPTIVTNHDLEQRMDTSDAWIRERSGIGERRVSGVTSEMGLDAATKAIEDAGIGAGDIDFVLLATCTPDQVIPATSTQITRGLGLTCGSMDINAACAGFAYGYAAAFGLMLAPGGPNRVLVVGADAMSKVVDWTDRGTAILFGDGAGAAVLERHEQGDLLGQDFGVAGDLREILYCNHADTIVMEGREVFKRAVRAVTQSVKNALDQAGLTPSDIDVVLPHQANVRIIEAVCSRLDIPMEKTHNVLEHTGNTSAASIPLAMAAANEAGALQPGKIVVMTGFGAGMAWGSVVVRW
ncbi:MAG: beta-ketoacyl-ACP synthase III [Acidimicrobiales bacterium]